MQLVMLPIATPVCVLVRNMQLHMQLQPQGDSKDSKDCRWDSKDYSKTTADGTPRTTPKLLQMGDGTPRTTSRRGY